jgi:hypothetical protein
MFPDYIKVDLIAARIKHEEYRKNKRHNLLKWFFVLWHYYGTLIILTLLVSYFSSDLIKTLTSLSTIKDVDAGDVFMLLFGCWVIQMFISIMVFYNDISGKLKKSPFFKSLLGDYHWAYDKSLIDIDTNKELKSVAVKMMENYYNENIRRIL